MHPFREITSDDVGKAIFHAFGRKWLTSGFIGQILPQDVGKRVYKINNILQVENDEQLNARKSKNMTDIPKEAIEAAAKAYYEIFQNEDTEMKWHRKALLAALKAAAPYMPSHLTNMELYYLKSILKHLKEFKGLTSELGTTIGTEALADNVDWLDCFIDARARIPARQGHTGINENGLGTFNDGIEAAAKMADQHGCNTSNVLCQTLAAAIRALKKE